MADNISLVGMDQCRRVPLSPAESMRLEQVPMESWIMRRFISNPTIEVVLLKLAELF